LKAATPARALALHTLLRVESGRSGLAAALASPATRELDPRERDLLHELVLGTLRLRGSIDQALERVVSRPLAEVDPALRAILRLGAHQILHLRVPAHAAVSQSVALARERRARGAGFVNAALRSLVRLGPPPMPDPEREPQAWLTGPGSLPAWLASRWLARLGPRAAVARARAMLEAPPTVFRLNPRLPDAGARLAESGVRARALDVPGAFRLEVGRLTALAEAGLVYVQDAGSQLVAHLAARPGRVLDACAAPGGKTTLLADLDPGGLVVACESSARRARTLAALVRRWGSPNVRCVRADAARPPFGTKFDVVVLDAPCSGLGTLGGNPDIRWRLHASDLPPLADRQQRLIQAQAALVRPGGLLVYSVCSLEPEEAEQLVERFLATHPGYRLLLPPPWARAFTDGPYVRVQPERHGGDGFFVALLERD